MFNSHAEWYYYPVQSILSGYFPDGPVVENPLCTTGDVGLTPGWEAKITHAGEQLSPHAATAKPQAPESVCHNWRICVPQPKIPHDSRRIPCAATETQRSQLNKYIYKSIFFFPPLYSKIYHLFMFMTITEV